MNGVPGGPPNGPPVGGHGHGHGAHPADSPSERTTLTQYLDTGRKSFLSGVESIKNLVSPSPNGKSAGGGDVSAGFAKKKPQRQMSYGVQLNSLINSTMGLSSGAAVAPGEGSGKNGSDKNEQDMANMSPEEVRSMMSGLLEERLRTDEVLPLEEDDDEDGGGEIKKSTLSGKLRGDRGGADVEGAIGGSAMHLAAARSGSGAVRVETELEKDISASNLSSSLVSSQLEAGGQYGVAQQGAKTAELASLVIALQASLVHTNQQLEVLKKAVHMPSTGAALDDRGKHSAILQHHRALQERTSADSQPPGGSHSASRHTTGKPTAGANSVAVATGGASATSEDFVSSSHSSSPLLGAGQHVQGSGKTTLPALPNQPNLPNSSAGAGDPGVAKPISSVDMLEQEAAAPVDDVQDFGSN